MKDFVINCITIKDGEYFFHNGNVTLRRYNITKEQIIKYRNYLQEQIGLCFDALLSR